MLASRRICFLLVALLALGVTWWGISTRLPWRTESPFQQALDSLQQGNLDHVAAQIQALSSQARFQPHVHLLQGAVYLRRNQLEDALREFAKSRPEGELREPGLLLAGECLYRLGRLEEAQALLEQLAQEQLANVDARRWLAAIDYDLGNLGEAISKLQQLTAMVPEDPAPHRFMGKIYQEDCRQYAKAVDCYRQTLARNPPPRQRQDVLHELSVALMQQGRYGEALPVLAEMEADARTLALLARCHWYLDRRDRARTLLERARLLDPNERSVLMLEARMKLEEDGPGAAVAPLQRVLAKDAHDFPCRYQLALMYQRLGATDAAEAELEQMRESKEFRNQLAELNVQARRLDDAAVRQRIADLCTRHGLLELAATWRRAAEASRNIGSAGELGPEWYAGTNLVDRTAPTSKEH